MAWGGGYFLSLDTPLISPPSLPAHLTPFSSLISPFTLFLLFSFSLPPGSALLSCLCWASPGWGSGSLPCLAISVFSVFHLLCLPSSISVPSS